MLRISVAVQLSLLILFSTTASADTGHHHLGVFGGAATSIHEDHGGGTHPETHVALGLEYEHRLSLIDERLGVELLGEWVLGDHTETVLGGGLVVHPSAGLRLAGATAVAIFYDHNALLLRGTVAYDFHIANASISPTLSADYVDHHVAFVYGVAIGLGI